MARPRHCSSRACGGEGATQLCGRCKTAVYCSKECQRAAWKRHKLWCGLVGTAIDGATCTVTFLGQWAPALHELYDDGVYGARALERRRRSAASGPPPPGGALPTHLELPQGVPLASMDAAAVAAYKALPEGDAVVLPTPRALLSPAYCLGSAPLFLLQAPEGAGGLTAADLASGTARAYQWAYEQEDRVSQPAPMGAFLLNRGPSNGPFSISMHDLGDLYLHSFGVSGPDAPLDAPAAVVLSPMIDS